MQRLFRIRKDNRGDTLIIVIVGILLLGILGSVVLASTTLNYSMKNIDRNQKKTFYTAEEAIDKVYAGVGQDVMDGMKYAYTYVLNNMMTTDVDGNYVTKDNTELNKAFRNIFYYYLTGKECNSEDLVSNWNQILYGNANNGIYYECNPIYKNGAYEQQELKNHLQSYIDEGASQAPEISIPQYTAENPNVAISYSTKLATSSSGNSVTLDCFTLNDISVTFKSNDGVTSKVGTDIVVEVPLIDINFSEVSTIDYGELFKYIVLAEGDANTTDPTVTVNSSTNFNGNVYAGKLASSTKTGILVNNSKLNITATNIASSGNIDVNNGEISFKRNAENDALKVWAKNISTSGLHDVINIDNADCVVKDDLDINGNGSTVKISGNYFGIGFRASSAANTIEANSNENDKMYFDSNAGKAYDSNGNVVGDLAEYEHEKSSAILVNGRDASLDLYELKTLLLGGRAYVDLIDPDAGLGENNSTYMTGESLSIRGNQEAYLATITDKTLYNFMNPAQADEYNVVKSNPVTYDFFRNNVLGHGILTDKTVAKKVGGNVYFYRASLSPTEQTELFESYFNESLSNKKTIREKADKLGVKLISINENSNILTVGSLMQVDANKADSQRVLLVNHTLENNNRNQFARYITDISLRYRAMLTELKDYGDISSTTVPSNVTGSINASTKTPISTYIDVDMFNNVFDGTVENENIANLKDSDGDGNMDTYEAVYDLQTSGIFTAAQMAEYNITNNNSYVVMTKAANYVVNNNISNGVIIAANNVTVSRDFTGIIISSGDVKIDNGNGSVTVALTACSDLSKWVSAKDTTLNACLKGYLSVSQGDGDGEATGHITLNDIKYQDLVSYSNWEKMAVNEEIDSAQGN